ncbi:MAG: Rab family GTPase [Candidatus Asgardarchaeia archaeon]
MKFVVVGETEVGKTSLISRWVKGIFPRFEEIKTTIGAAFTVKEYSNDPSFYLQIWDFAGQSRFTKFMYSLLNGARAGLLVFDLSNLTTLDVLENFWIPHMHDILKIDFTQSTKLPFILVGNKLDLVKNTDKQALALEEVNEFRKKFKLDFISVSAKTGENIQAMESMIISKIKSMVLATTS